MPASLYDPFDPDRLIWGRLNCNVFLASAWAIDTILEFEGRWPELGTPGPAPAPAVRGTAHVLALASIPAVSPYPPTAAPGEAIARTAGAEPGASGAEPVPTDNDFEIVCEYMRLGKQATVAERFGIDQPRVSEAKSRVVRYLKAGGSVPEQFTHRLDVNALLNLGRKRP